MQNQINIFNQLRQTGNETITLFHKLCQLEVFQFLKWIWTRRNLNSRNKKNQINFNYVRILTMIFGSNIRPATFHMSFPMINFKISLSLLSEAGPKLSEFCQQFVGVMASVRHKKSMYLVFAAHHLTAYKLVSRYIPLKVLRVF